MRSQKEGFLCTLGESQSQFGEREGKRENPVWQGFSSRIWEMPQIPSYQCLSTSATPTRPHNPIPHQYTSTLLIHSTQISNQEEGRDDEEVGRLRKNSSFEPVGKHGENELRECTFLLRRRGE